MSIQNAAPPGPQGTSNHRRPADTAYRRAWWSLALYPVTFVAAFVIGEGLYSALTHDQGDAAIWQVLVAGTPALLVFVIPGVLAAIQGRKAMRLGRRDGQVPAIVGAVVAILFVGQNLLSFAALLLFG
jgi:hypothetical protein